MKRLLIVFALLGTLCLALPASAQITPPNTFVGGTTILASKVNENFAKFGDALNRTGGTMTGALLFSTDNTLDIGASGATRPRRIYIGTEVVSPLFTGGAFSGTTGTFSGALSGASLALTGAVTGVTDFTASGTVTGGTFSGSGASLTSIPEASITDGAVFPRLAGTESISGAWTFSNAGTALTVSTGAVSFQAVGGTTGTFSGAVSASGFSGSGASLTSIPETAITDGSIFARVGSTETITGAWTLNGTVTMSTRNAIPFIYNEYASFGGDWREYVSGTSYPSGATYDKLVSGSGVAYFSTSELTSIGTWGIEATCKSNDGTGTGYIALFDLDGGTPDTALTGSEVSAVLSTTGTRLRSTAITFPSAVSRAFGAKVKISSGYISCFNVRLIRLS